jgi:hypothetical protein
MRGVWAYNGGSTHNVKRKTHHSPRYRAPMFSSCIRCPTPASSLMLYSYEDRLIWLDDPSISTITGYAMCASHADRLTPPLGWTLVDRRTVRRLFAPLEVA